MASAGDFPAAAPPPSIIDRLGEEIVRIVAPVSLCMLLVVLLTAALSTPFDSSSLLSTIAAAAAPDSSDDSGSGSSWQEMLAGAVFISIVFVAVITAVTFLLVLLFYLRWTAFLRYYMAFSSFIVLAFMGGELSVFILRRFDLPLDCVTFFIILFNFAAVGAVAVLAAKGVVPILLTQGYLVLIGVLVAYWFTMLPEWTTWALLVSMALYDLAAVLLPVGPLRLLVELAISRDEEIPALVYEARPVLNPHENNTLRRGIWRDQHDPESGSAGAGADADPDSNSTNVPLPAPEMRVTIAGGGDAGDEEDSLASALLTTPLMAQPLQRTGSEDLDGIGLSSSGAIKLGLGDFIFYSVLVGRAAMYDFTTVYACYLAIVAGLGVTLLLLAFFRRALPALPISIALGVVFYLLTRFLLEEFLVQCSINLVMF